MQNLIQLCTERDMKLLLLMLATVCMSKVKSQESDAEPYLVSVSRRLSSDFYYYNGSSGASACDNELYINITYLVDDGLCVAEEELFRRGKYFLTSHLLL